jgi:hypothetical protein
VLSGLSLPAGPLPPPLPPRVSCKRWSRLSAQSMHPSTSLLAPLANASINQTDQTCPAGHQSELVCPAARTVPHRSCLATPSTGVAGKLDLVAHKVSSGSCCSCPSGHYWEDRPCRVAAGHTGLGRGCRPTDSQWVVMKVELHFAGIPGLQLDVRRLAGCRPDLLGQHGDAPLPLFVRSLLPSCVPSILCGSP